MNTSLIASAYFATEPLAYESFHRWAAPSQPAETRTRETTWRRVSPRLLQETRCRLPPSWSKRPQHMGAVSKVYVNAGPIGRPGKGIPCAHPGDHLRDSRRGFGAGGRQGYRCGGRRRERVRMAEHVVRDPPSDRLPLRNPGPPRAGRRPRASVPAPGAPPHQNSRRRIVSGGHLSGHSPQRHRRTGRCRNRLSSGGITLDDLVGDCTEVVADVLWLLADAEWGIPFTKDEPGLPARRKRPDSVPHVTGD